MKAKYIFLVLGFSLISLLAQAQPQTILIAADTITNTEVDTVPIPYVLDSKGYSYDVSYHIVATQLSGTANLNVKHIVSNQNAGNNWFITGDSVTHSGASSSRLMRVNDVINARSGLRVVGTGAQSTRYQIYARLVRRSKVY